MRGAAAHANADANSDIDADANGYPCSNADRYINCNSYIYAYGDSHVHSDAHANSHSHSYVNCDANADSHSDSETFTYSAGSPYSGAPPVKTLISLELQPLLYARPEFANTHLQIATEINVSSALERHRPRAARDLAEVFD